MLFRWYETRSHILQNTITKGLWLEWIVCDSHIPVPSPGHAELRQWVSALHITSLPVSPLASDLGGDWVGSPSEPSNMSYGFNASIAVHLDWQVFYGTIPAIEYCPPYLVQSVHYQVLGQNLHWSPKRHLPGTFGLKCHLLLPGISAMTKDLRRRVRQQTHWYWVEITWRTCTAEVGLPIDRSAIIGCSGAEDCITPFCGVAGASTINSMKGHVSN